MTAFFDIGSFGKGYLDAVRRPTDYYAWMEPFRYMENPVVFYTDSRRYFEYFYSLRNKTSSNTQVILLSRNVLWPFQIKSNISQVYSQPEYPKHRPNTLVPKYTCLTHAKVPVLADCVARRRFNTEYYSWVDVGYFRDICQQTHRFRLEVPSNFNSSKIGMTRVYDVDFNQTKAENIIRNNENWVGGGVYLGKRDPILLFAKDYKNATLRFLSRKLMNVEQHIIYSMYTKEERATYSPKVELQTYIPGTQTVLNLNPWFYLGYLMYTPI